MTEECKLSFLPSSCCSPLERGLQGLVEGLSCGCNLGLCWCRVSVGTGERPGSGTPRAAPASAQHPQPHCPCCGGSSAAHTALCVWCWECSGRGDAPVVPGLWDHPVPLLGSHSHCWESSWMRAGPAGHWASSSSLGEPQVPGLSFGVSRECPLTFHLPAPLGNLSCPVLPQPLPCWGIHPSHPGRWHRGQLWGTLCLTPLWSLAEGRSAAGAVPGVCQTCPHLQGTSPGMGAVCCCTPGEHTSLLVKILQGIPWAWEGLGWGSAPMLACSTCSWPGTCSALNGLYALV